LSDKKNFHLGVGASLSIAALMYCACTSVPEDYCGGGDFYFNNQFCFNGCAYDKCGGRSYDPTRKKCVGGVPVDIDDAPSAGTLFTITLDANGGEGSQESVTTETNGKLSSLPPGPSREGYTFSGWYTGKTDGDKISVGYVFSANATIYAQWMATTYTIGYDLAGGAVSPDNPASYNIETASFTLNEPTRSGYIFNGWTGSNGAMPQTSVSVDKGSMGNRNYTANWGDTGSFVDVRDVQRYKKVKIGGQWWMAENLNYNTFLDTWSDETWWYSWCYGEDVYDHMQTNGEVQANGNKYGRLYNWNTAVTVCPEGWRLPTNAEWDALVTAVGISSAGTKLKSSNYWNYYSDNYIGTDDYGFSALPGGFRKYSDGSFYSAGNQGYWWTATEDDDGLAYGRVMLYNFDIVGEVSDGDKGNGFSVRCVAD